LIAWVFFRRHEEGQLLWAAFFICHSVQQFSLSGVKIKKSREEHPKHGSFPINYDNEKRRKEQKEQEILFY
jgi:hypothetical protein